MGIARGLSYLRPRRGRYDTVGRQDYRFNSCEHVRRLPAFTDNGVSGNVHTRIYGRETAKYEILKARARKVREVVYSPKYEELWDVYPFHAGYFMCIRLKNGNADAIRLRLLDEHGIGVVSLGDSDLRIAFSCVEESDIQSLFDTIAQATAV